MSDNNIRDDEEYKYPEDEYVIEQQHSVEPESGAEQQHHAESEEAAPNKPESNLMLFVRRNKRKLGVAAIAIIALIAFQIMKYEKNNKVIKQAPANVVSKPKPQAAATLTPAQSEAALNHARLSNEINTLTQAGQANAETISKVQTQLSDMRQQLNQAHQTNQQLRQAMVLLLQELKRVNTHLSEKPKVTKAGLPAPEVIYTVRAMVDNRAWIVGNNGLSESVTVGDPVPDYGIVEKVDAAAGVIKTSSGKVIKLGLNDY